MLKNKDKLLNISQTAKILGLKNKKNQKPSTHTLRFWETKFKQLKPTILSGNRRYYSAKNIKILKLIIFLLKEQGLTINGAIFLGLKGPVVKSHGSTDAFGFYHSIDLCYRIIKGDLMNKIKNNLSHINEDIK